MNFIRIIFISIIIVVMSSFTTSAPAFEKVVFDTEDGGKIEASFFSASNNKVVIFAHGAIFNKESWYFLAGEFHNRGVSALSVDFRGYGNSQSGNTSKKMYDVLGAISYLTERDFTDINIVGGSMGGAAVLMALGNNSTPINHVVLLAPAGGPAITSTVTNKLFIVSEAERMFEGVTTIYNASAGPKQIQVYPGNTHAQHLFKTDVRNELIERIINFIIQEPAK
jgi:esterase/lipase